MPTVDHTAVGIDKRDKILDAVIRVLGRDGISGVTMRAVSREAGVALGLMNYYFDDKVTLVGAALERVAAADQLIVTPDAELSPRENLRVALGRIADPSFLTVDYLAVRLHLWSLAQAEPEYSTINQQAQARYLAGLADLIAAAHPSLDRQEVDTRAEDILVIQNGMWLTSVLIPDAATVARSLERTESIASGVSLAPPIPRKQGCATSRQIGPPLHKECP